MSAPRTYVIDVFAAEPFSGSPAAVVLNADSLPEPHLAALAREFNLPCTAFVLRPTTRDAAVALRWFTPVGESRFSAHGSIAAIHALIDSGRFVNLPTERGTILPVQTPRGLMTARCELLPGGSRQRYLVWLDLPRPRLTDKPQARRLWGQMFGVPVDAFDPALPPQQTQDRDVLVFLKALPPLMEARPDFRQLAVLSRQQGVAGWCLATTATLTPSITVQSRFFAPAAGIDEVPVSGRIHGPLAACLVTHRRVPLFGEAAALSCTQSDSRARAGLVRAVVKRQTDGGLRVRIAGQCVTVQVGELAATAGGAA